jgi:hypothetical protein
MSAHPTYLRLPAPERVVPARFALSGIFLVVAIVGAVLSLLGAIFQPHQFAYSWFFGFYTFFTILVGSLFWVLLHYVCNGSWDILIRRIWENLTALFPLLFTLFLPLLLIPALRDTLWGWMALSPATDHELADVAGYLNQPFFYIRVILYFGFFIGVSRYYRNGSVQQDTDGNPVGSYRRHIHSYFAMVVFGVVETLAAWDWFMGLRWEWTSSLFGVYHFAVCAQAGMAACIVIMAWMQGHGLLGRLNHEHYHLAGKLLFGFTIFWAYTAFGQFLLIWYANIPDESIFYNDHNRYLWKYVTYFLIVGKFMFPVIYLLAQDTKRSLRPLVTIAIWILFMHAVEMYWFIAPFAHPTSIVPSWQDPVALATIGSILGYAYIRIMSGASTFPVRDPRLAECLTVTN